MDKPTQEQQREFWEWCGFVYHPTWTTCWKYPKGDSFSTYNKSTLPKITLNTLFKYAVPKLDRWELRNFIPHIFSDSTPRAEVCLISDEDEIYGEGEDENPALALFWAIFEVIKNGNR